MSVLVQSQRIDWNSKKGYDGDMLMLAWIAVVNDLV